MIPVRPAPWRRAGTMRLLAALLLPALLAPANEKALEVDPDFENAKRMPEQIRAKKDDGR